MPNYENETCASCLRWLETNCPKNDDDVNDSDPICPDFAPSIECRKVVALEALAKAVVYDCAADCFAIVTTDSR